MRIQHCAYTIFGFLSFFSLVFLTPANCIFAQAEAVLTAEGPVISVDSVAGTLSLNVTADGTSSEKTFSTDNDTVVSYGEELILFSDIQAGHEVNVTYSVTPDGNSIATFIAVKI